LTVSNLIYGLVFSILVTGCGLRLPAAGIAGKYQMGRFLLTKPQGLGVGEAISYLEPVAKKDPYYKDTLTLLGRAYYQQKRYQEALWVLQKALELNRKDEIGWITLGLAQLRLDDDEKGLHSLQTGLALLNGASKGGYRGYLNWDPNGVVRTSIRKTIVQVAEQGLNGKEQIIRASEVLLARIDNEERSQQGDKSVEKWIQLGDE
jgi:tetratricopeptide (TPR) repeat protein